MTLQNSRELGSTRRKLALLEQQVDEIRQGDRPAGRADTLTVRSLTRLINQLKEEIAQFETTVPG